jgi:hypothetical protein
MTSSCHLFPLLHNNIAYSLHNKLKLYLEFQVLMLAKSHLFTLNFVLSLLILVSYGNNSQE